MGFAGQTSADGSPPAALRRALQRQTVLDETPKASVVASIPYLSKERISSRRVASLGVIFQRCPILARYPNPLTPYPSLRILTTHPRLPSARGF
jgi:hypothetical protein